MKDRITPDNWTIDDGKLYRRYVFAGFPEAMAFMLRCAFLAEKADHHPEWLNVYNRVEVWLTTHDAGSLTQKDYDLANAFEEVWRQMGTGGATA
ncbi:MAG TPA: 4a-hydroxytetrahydrobiopterin dehydratase [Thermopetrobacter sp.]|nr:4a-hydroxytetrahydrobiopterin dehydratase [Thermopetrobacter sp.]